MADVFDTAKRSDVMSRIRGTGNKTTELALARAFRTAGIKGWRRHALLNVKLKPMRGAPVDAKLSVITQFDGPMFAFDDGLQSHRGA